MAILWRIELFGGLRAQRLDETPPPVRQPLDHFRSRREAALLAFLAFSLRSHARETLAELLWPGHDVELSRGHLRVVLSSLRRTLEPPGVLSGSVVIADRNFIRLHRGTVTTDVAAFESSLQEASQSMGRMERNAHLARALDLYDVLLPGYYEEWIAPETRRLEELYFTALRQLISEVEADNPRYALQLAQRGVRVSAVHEDIGRDLMRLYVATGQPALALRQYHQIEDALQQQLNTTPSLQTRELMRYIESGRGLPSETLKHNQTSKASFTTIQEAFVALSSQKSDAESALMPSHLPPQWTRFFGRDGEITTVYDWLNDGKTRLVTLTGVGGSGKTHLAIEVARLLGEDRTTQGALWFVPLANLSNASLIAGAITDAMRLPHIPQLAPMTQALQALAAHAKPVLVLDNFEHLLPEGASLIQEFLARLPQLRLLVTSRHDLQIADEHPFSIPSLVVPALGLSPDLLLRVASVQLFHDRARMARPRFQITRHNASAVTQLCICLEGLPLAIELCAVKSDTFSPAKMLIRLEHRLNFLDDSAPDSTYQHPTLRATLEWSYELLWPELQSFFAKLCIFRGGCTPQVAAAITGETHAAHLLHQLSLASLSTGDSRAGETRYFLLEVVREFACEKLLPAEKHSLAQRHAELYGALAQSAESHLMGPLQGEWLDRLESDIGNLRAAMEWAEQGDAALCLRMVGALGHFWLARGYYAEGRRWIQSVLRQNLAEVNSKQHMKLLGMEAEFSWYSGEFADALAIHERRLLAAQDARDVHAETEALHCLGYAAAQMGEFERARPILERSLALSRELGDDRLLSAVLLSVISEASAVGDFARVYALGDEGAQLSRRLGDTRQSAFVLNMIGFTAVLKGDLGRARPLLEESLALSETVGEKWHTNRAWWTLGHLARLEGDFAQALSLFDHALRELRVWGCLWPLPYHLEPRAYMSIAEGNYERAAHLLGAAQGLREAMRHALHPVLRPEYERHIASLHEKFDATSLKAAWSVGRALSWEAAVSLALETF